MKNAFLNGDLIEEVYRKPPSSLQYNISQVCKLRRALYELKKHLELSLRNLVLCYCVLVLVVLKMIHLYF